VQSALKEIENECTIQHWRHFIDGSSIHPESEELLQVNRIDRLRERLYELDPTHQAAAAAQQVEDVDFDPEFELPEVRELRLELQKSGSRLSAEATTRQSPKVTNPRIERLRAKLHEVESGNSPIKLCEDVAVPRRTVRQYEEKTTPQQPQQDDGVEWQEKLMKDREKLDRENFLQDLKKEHAISQIEIRKEREMNRLQDRVTSEIARAAMALPGPKPGDDFDPSRSEANIRSLKDELALLTNTAGHAGWQEKLLESNKSVRETMAEAKAQSRVEAKEAAKDDEIAEKARIQARLGGRSGHCAAENRPEIASRPGQKAASLNKVVNSVVHRVSLQILSQSITAEGLTQYSSELA